MNTLITLHEDIDARVEDIRTNNPDWLCRMGCDLCCRRLAEMPSLTHAEWNLFKEGLMSLPKTQFIEVSQKITALAAQTMRPIICPMLDLSAGACMIYEYRPVACRTYGFYVQRDLGSNWKSLFSFLSKVIFFHFFCTCLSKSKISDFSV